MSKNLDIDIDTLLEHMSIEELQELANLGSNPIEEHIDSSKVDFGNNHIDTINIYMNETQKRASHPYDDSPCPDCGQAYCICDMEVEESNSSLAWYAYPIWLMPFTGIWALGKLIFSMPKTSDYIDTEEQPKAIGVQEDIQDDVIDTEIVEEFDENEVIAQLELYKTAKGVYDPLLEESQRLTEQFNKMRGVA